MYNKLGVAKALTGMRNKTKLKKNIVKPKQSWT